MLIEELEKANIAALKARDNSTRAILSVVINRYRLQAIEAKSQGKTIGDPELVKIITKVIKELDEEKEGNIKANRLGEVANIDQQRKVIEQYLPKLLTEDEIRSIIAKLEDKSLPSVMKHFKINYDGQVDMSIVSKIARE